MVYPVLVGFERYYSISGFVKCWKRVIRFIRVKGVKKTNRNEYSVVAMFVTRI